MPAILWAIAIILLVVWLAGLVLDFMGGAIHILLIVALAAIIWNFVTSRRTA